MWAIKENMTRISEITPNWERFFHSWNWMYRTSGMDDFIGDMSVNELLHLLRKTAKLNPLLVVGDTEKIKQSLEEENFVIVKMNGFSEKDRIYDIALGHTTKDLSAGTLNFYSMPVECGYDALELTRGLFNRRRVENLRRRYFAYGTDEQVFGSGFPELIETQLDPRAKSGALTIAVKGYEVRDFKTLDVELKTLVEKSRKELLEKHPETILF